MDDATKDAYVKQIKDLERIVMRQRADLSMMQRVIERKNKELTALHFVWCSGPCGAPLTREIVEEAIRNTDRLIAKFNGQRSNRAWRLLSDYPDEQKALLSSWQMLRRHADREIELQRRVDELEARCEGRDTERTA